MQIRSNHLRIKGGKEEGKKKKKNSTQRLNERMKEKKGDKRKNPFEWQEAVS